MSARVTNGLSRSVGVAVAASACAFVVAAGVATAQTPASPAPGGRTLAPVRTATPVAFESEQDSTGQPARFVTRGREHAVRVTARDATFELPQSGGERASIQLSFAGSNRDADIAGFGAVPGRFFRAPAAARGTLTGHSRFRELHVSDLYDGIDLVYYLTDRQLEFDFVVAPQADPDAVRLSFPGADRMQVSDSGVLIVEAGGHEVRLERPIVYQDRDGRRREIDGEYVLDSDSGTDVRIRVGDYDRTLPLIIDPIVSLAGYLGGAGDEFPSALHVGRNGEVYLFGRTTDKASFPTTHSFPLAPQFPGDCFLTKLAPDGMTVRYSIVFEGAWACTAMAVEGSGQVHLSMSTNVSMLRTLTEDAAGTLTLTTLKGVFDYFLGPALHMAVDRNGDVYLDVFHDEQGLQYSLFKVGASGLLGTIPLLRPFIDTTTVPYPTQVDQITGLAVDEFGRVSAIGIARSNAITPTANALQPARRDANPAFSDGFVLQVDTNTGGAFQTIYASYLGGSHDDRPFTVTVDSTGTALIGGGSSSTDFPTTPGAWARTPGFGFDAFLVRLDPSLPPDQQLRFSTFLGANAAWVTSIAVLPGGLAAIAGEASDVAFPFVNPIYSGTASAQRPFVGVFSATGSDLLFSSFLAPAGDSYNALIAANGSSYLFATMTTQDETLATPGTPRSVHAGGFDAVVQKVDVSDLLPDNNAPVVDLGPARTLTATSPSGALFEFDCVTCSITDPDGDPIVGYTLTMPDGSTMTDSSQVPFNRVRLPIGTHTFTLAVEDVRGAVTTATLMVHVLGINTATSGIAIPLRNDDFFQSFVTNLVTPAQVTFEDVNEPGLTWVSTRVNQNPPAPPSGSQGGAPLLQAGTPPVYYDVFTTAEFDGNVRVCLDTRGMTFADPSTIRMYRLAGLDWTPLTSASSGTDLCALTDTLNTSFAIFYQPVPSTAIETIAGTGFYQGEIDGDPSGGSDPRDNFVDGGPATASAIGTLFGGAVDRARGYVYFASGHLAGGAIYRMDLAAGTLHLAAGNSHRPFTIDGQGGDPADDPLDGAPALQYPLNMPGTMAVDTAGNVYFSERIHTFQNAPGLELCAILKLDVATETITRLAGHAAAPSSCGLAGDGGLAVDARLGEVRAMTFDAAGHLFLSDEINARIRRIDADTGEIATVAGGGTELLDGRTLEGREANLGSVHGLAFDPAGNLLFSAGHLWQVHASPADGSIRGRVGAGELITPMLQCGWPGLTPPRSCQQRPLGGDGLPLADAVGFAASAVTIAADGSILTVHGNRIRRARPGRPVETIAGFEYDVTSTDFGGTGNSGSGFFNGDRYATNSTLAFPIAVLDDPRGGILILDANNRRIRRVALGNGSTDTTPPVLSLPATIAVDSDSPTGAVVHYLVSAVDDVDGPVAVSCSPGSGSTFPLAGNGPTSTVVTCSATDAAGNTATGTFTVVVRQSGPIVLTISENIVIGDAVYLLPSAVLNIHEPIVVSDASLPLPSVLLDVAEHIVVSDASAAIPSAMLSILERITVSDAAAPAPAVLTVSIAPATSTNDLLIPAQFTAFVSDGSDEASRVVFQSSLGSFSRVTLVDPAAPNSPLSVSWFQDAALVAHVAVSLATSATGALTSTAAQVAAAVAASVPQVLLRAAIWPGSTGAGIVQPRPETYAAVVFFAIEGVHQRLTTSCGTTLPGFCSTGYAGNLVGTDTLTATVDVNGNLQPDPGEPSATATATWVDRRPPVLSVPASVVREATGPAGAEVLFIVNAQDSPDGAVPVTCTPPSGSTFGFGITTVTCTAQDAAGNAATASFDVTVRDTTPPALNLPASFAVAAATPAGALVTYAASAADVVSGAVPISCSRASGTMFPAGPNTVTCTATDASGNVATGSFTVNIQDVQLVATAVVTRNGAGEYEAAITIRNVGSAPAVGLQLTVAQLNTASGVPLPAPVGVLAPGANTTIRETFAASAGPRGSGALRLQLNWTGGSLTTSLRVVLP